jgi:hypothetical protein
MGLLDGILLSKVVLSSKELAAIGSVAVESTYSDFIIESMIWAICKLRQDQGKFFTSGMMMDRKLELLGDLWKPLLADTPRAKLTEIISGLKEANNRRNIVIHGEWSYPKAVPFSAIRTFMTDPDKADSVATKRRLRSEPLQLRSNQVDEVAQRISSLTLQLLTFAYQEGFEPSSPGISPSPPGAR